MRVDRRWLARGGAALFALALLYPFTALFARIGPWQWGEDVRGPVPGVNVASFADEIHACAPSTKVVVPTHLEAIAF
jgi:hypothetical protein